MRGALVGAHERGVNVRLVYNLDEDDARPPVPPPPKTEPSLIESLPFETAAVPGWPDLMHHKYVVRDRDAVWTGSTNWTDDSWTREENVIVIVASTGVAIRFQEDFAQLWKKREVAASGQRARRDPIRVGDAPVRTWFSPKRGEKLAHRIAHAIGARGAARPRRVAGDHLGPDPRNARRGGRGRQGRPRRRRRRDADRTRCSSQWRLNGNVTWKAPSLKFLLERADFTGKRSTPYAPGAVHDYMHAKVTRLPTTRSSSAASTCRTPARERGERARDRRRGARRADGRLRRLDPREVSGASAGLARAGSAAASAPARRCSRRCS